MTAAAPRDAAPPAAGVAERTLFGGPGGDPRPLSRAVARAGVLAASAVDRLAVALTLAAGLWIAVAWALDWL